MKCKEILNVLGDFVDSELQEEPRSEVRNHLDDCPACQQAYQGATRLKRLVQVKSFKPPLPSGLSTRIFRKIRRDTGTPISFRRSRTVRRALAACLLGIIAVSCVYYLITPPSPLAHAEAMQEIAKRYQSLNPPPVSLKRDRRILKEISEKTAITLHEIPKIAGGELVTWAKDSLSRRPCVRLDYVVKGPAVGGPGAPAKAGAPRRKLSIFVVPLSKVDLPKDLINDMNATHLCNCIKVKGMTIFCFRDASNSLNLVANVEPKELDELPITLGSRTVVLKTNPKE